MPSAAPEGSDVGKVSAAATQLARCARGCGLSFPREGLARHEHVSGLRMARLGSAALQGASTAAAVSWPQAGSSGCRLARPPCGAPGAAAAGRAKRRRVQGPAFGYAGAAHRPPGATQQSPRCRANAPPRIKVGWALMPCKAPAYARVGLLHSHYEHTHPRSPVHCTALSRTERYKPPKLAPGCPHRRSRLWHARHLHDMVNASHQTTRNAANGWHPLTHRGVQVPEIAARVPQQERRLCRPLPDLARQLLRLQAPASRRGLRWGGRSGAARQHAP